MIYIISWLGFSFPIVSGEFFGRIFKRRLWDKARRRFWNVELQWWFRMTRFGAALQVELKGTQGVFECQKRKSDLQKTNPNPLRETQQNDPLTVWCLHVNDSIQPIVPIRSRCVVRKQLSIGRSLVVPSKIFGGPKDPYPRFLQETDDERIGSNPPFRNIPEIFDIVRATPLSRNDNSIRTRFVGSTDPSLRQLR